MTHYQMPVIPEGLYKILVRLHKDYHPSKIYITENGASYQEHPDRNGQILDEARIDYIYTHLEMAHKAMEEGVPLAGYFVWSLFDNFEWLPAMKPVWPCVRGSQKPEKNKEKEL